jgi:YD repeat-containing protein
MGVACLSVSICPSWENGSTEKQLHHRPGLHDRATDGRGNTLTLTYDALNRQVNFIDALNNRTTTVYDLASNVIRAIDEEGNATTFTYDALNRQVLTHGPNGQKTTLVWDAGSNLVRTDVLASTTLGLTAIPFTFWKPSRKREPLS